MPKNLFAVSDDFAIFDKEELLYPDFVPEKLPFRDNEVELIVHSLKPVTLGRKPVNLLLYGGTGVGKTVVAKYILRELEEFSDRAKPVFVNCMELKSRHSVLFKIANSLGIVVPRQGVSSMEVFERFSSELNKLELIPVIVLDEADVLLSTSDGSKLLYDLLKINESTQKRLGLILISNDLTFLSILDPRVKSRLNEQSIFFEPYSVQQLKEILSHRSSKAFLPDALSKDVLGLAAAHAFRLGGDARVAIECLWKAGKLAEKHSEKNVTVNHLNEAINLVDNTYWVRKISYLSESEKQVLMVFDSKPMASGKAFKKYSEKQAVALKERAFRFTLSKLQSLNLVSSEIQRGGKKGATRLVSLNFDKKLLEKI
ncbi:MAG: AAA family ATPase [archaeon]